MTPALQLVEIPYQKVEISFCNTPTKRSPNLAHFVKTSKSGDGGGSGGSLRTKGGKELSKQNIGLMQKESEKALLQFVAHTLELVKNE
jgi:hypothetical protein